MPARTGAEYLAGLKEQPREIWLDGRRIDDVTEFPGLANGARSIAGLYDMQRDANAGCDHDVPLAEYRRPSGPVVHHPENCRRPGATSQHDVRVGARQLRDDGAHARLSQRNHHGDGGGRRLLWRQPAGVQAERR